MWIVPAVLVLGMLVFALFKGLGWKSNGPNNAVPSFDLTVTQAVPFPVTDKDPAQFATQAKRVASQVGRTMTSLYTEAFLDPKNWRSGSYDNVWPLFDDGSRTTAQQDRAMLTLGARAGETYDEITRPSGTVAVKVLLDKENKPSTAVAIVKFTALGIGKDGTNTLMVSRGQFFLRPGDSSWTIYAFQVRRGSRTVAPEVSPSGSPGVVAS